MSLNPAGQERLFQIRALGIIADLADKAGLSTASDHSGTHVCRGAAANPLNPRWRIGPPSWIAVEADNHVGDEIADATDQRSRCPHRSDLNLRFARNFACLAQVHDLGTLVQRLAVVSESQDRLGETAKLVFLDISVALKH